jgi:hypothetical protein
MAFCKNCGTKLQGDERFCVGCGADVSAKGNVAATPAPQGTVPSAQVLPAHPVAGIPGNFLPPGAIPIAVMQPQAPPKHGGWMKTLLVIAVVVGVGYYFVKHLPPSPADPGTNAALTKLQAFDAHWQAVYGFVQVSNGKWTNNANVAIASATLECDQYDSNGRDLAQMRTTLNGPIQPGASANFNPFQMGAVATNVYKVTCTIVHVKTGNSGQ